MLRNSFLLILLLLAKTLIAQDFVEESNEDPNVSVDKIKTKQRRRSTKQNEDHNIEAEEKISHADALLEKSSYEENENGDKAYEQKKYQLKKAHEDMNPINYETIPVNDTNLGVQEKIHFFDEDRMRLSAGGGLSPFVDELFRYQGLEGNFSYRIDEIWIDFFANLIRSEFSVVGQNVHFASVSSSEGMSVHAKNENLLITSFGAGPSFRRPFFFFPEYRFFQVVGFGFEYIGVQNFTNHLEYQGLGLKAHYLLLQRITDSFDYGLKFSYDFGTIQRQQLNSSESTRDRRLYLSWISISLNVGFNF